MELSAAVRRALLALLVAVLSLALLATAGASLAQVHTDGSLGRRQAITGDVLIIDDRLGSVRGTSLFQSFETFNVNEGQAAAFVTAPGTERVVSRVTGDLRTRIDGPISVVDRGLLPASADFWMINPNGMVLGPNARFNLGSGSLHLSAGDAVVFADGAEFRSDTASPVLSSAAPVEFGFLGAPPGRLELAGADLNLGGERAVFVGGEVTLDDGRLRSSRVEGSNVNPGTDIALIAGAQGDVIAVEDPSAGLGSTGGSVRVSGAPDAAGNAPLRIRTEGGGGVTLGGAVVTIRGAGVRSDSGADTRAGTLRLNGGDIRLRSGATVGSLTRSPADAGAVVVRGRSLSVVSGAQILSQTQGAGASGPIDVGVSEGLRLARDGVDAATGISSSVAGGANGGAGTVSIAARDVVVEDDGRIFSNTRGRGDAGVVSLSAETMTLLGGGQVGSGVLDSGEADGEVSGAGGLVRIDASTSLEISGEGRQPKRIGIGFQPSGVFTSTESQSPTAGPAGRIFVTVPVLRMSQRGEIASESFNDADAGEIVVNARDISLRAEAEITTQAQRADSGLISIVGADRVRLESDARISTVVSESGAAGRAGDIEITDAGAIALRDDGLILTDVSGAGALGDAGDINLTGTFLVLDGSTVAARGIRGQGGNIAIAVEGLAVSPDSTISALSRFSLDGDVDIDSPAGEVLDALAPLPTNLVSAADRLRASCGERAAGRAGGVFIVGDRASALPSAGDTTLLGFPLPLPDGDGADRRPPRPGGC